MAERTTTNASKQLEAKYNSKTEWGGQMLGEKAKSARETVGRIGAQGEEWETAANTGNPGKKNAPEH